ncbi:MAG: type IV pilus modification protein PilV [Acinetobacter sp.]|nr:MAG: type IV pilus modification protein PilV [Acinetobacter sp.]
MDSQRNQLGVGLMEVLVALLLLAIGVLGYTGLQLRAVDAGNEALIKSQATMMLRGLAESIRANTAGQASYPAAVQSYVAIEPNTAAPKSCLNATCTAAEMASYQAHDVARNALGMGVRMTMTRCPGVASGSLTQRQCLFAAWEGTTLTATDYSNCMTTQGVYVPASRCIMMEAY